MVVAVALLVGACAGEATVDGPVMTSPASTSDEGMGAEVTGALSFDGQCVFISHPDQPEITYPVLWPEGTRWQRDPPAVVLPDGVTAAMGSVVAGGGGYLYVDGVVGMAGEEVGEKAAACVQPPYEEIAVFNPGSQVTVDD